VPCTKPDWPTDRRFDFDLRFETKLHHGLTSMETRCKIWNIKINEDKAWALHYSYRIIFPGFLLTQNGRNIPHVRSVNYFGVIFDQKVTWRIKLETVEAKAFKIFIRLHFLIKNCLVSTNAKLTLHKSFTVSVIIIYITGYNYKLQNRLSV
jgi:hypothetical protein